MFVGDSKLREATRDYIEHHIHEEIERAEGFLSEGSVSEDGSEKSDHGEAQTVLHSNNVRLSETDDLDMDVLQVDIRVGPDEIGSPSVGSKDQALSAEEADKVVEFEKI